MSRSSQQAFLLKLQQELISVSSTEGNAAQRNLFNKRGHVFTITSRAIKRGLREGIVSAFSEGTNKEAKAFAAKVSKQSDADIVKFITTLTNRYRVQERQGKATVTFASKRKLVVVIPPEGDVFGRIKGVYNRPLNTLFDSINRRSKGILSRRGELFNLEHGQFVGVLETTVRDTIDNVLSDFNPDGNTLKNVKNFFESQGLDVSVIRNSKTDTMQVFLGSFVSNQAERQESQTKKKDLLSLLNKAIDKLQKNPAFAFEELKGSDNFKTKKRKQTVKAVTDPFKNKKRIKVTTEDTKIKESKTNVSKKVKPKVRVTTKTRKSTVRKSKLTGGFSQVKLYAALSAKINATVAKNMGDPALNFRTGRFAQSVQITDVNKTRQGFPSVGYTYQLYPYQTFEPGFEQGSPERDPRKLIDRSIREIAAQMVTGRIYTRRN